MVEGEHIIKECDKLGAGQLTPLRRGLYVLKRVTLALGRLKLQLAPVLPRMEAAELDAWSSKAGAARPKPPLGSADSAG